MQRRSFLTLLGGAAAAWPLAARAQQPGMSVIAYLSARSAETDVAMLAALRRGLVETGYAEGRNLAIEYRYANGQYDRMPILLAELTRQRVGVVVVVGVTGEEKLLRDMRASQIPIVFNIGPDPVRVGLAASLARPGGNLTGIYVLLEVLSGKNLSLLTEFMPSAQSVAYLRPSGGNVRSLRDTRQAAATLGLHLVVLEASTDSELEAAFATLQRQPVDAMISGSSPFFMTRAKQITALAASHRLPTIFLRREFAEAGGLMSYGYDIADGYRHLGIYAGRILKGDKPADLPVFQPTKFQLVINRKTAKAIGLEIPDKLIALADEVIE
jgi:putative ABC transport system substrate-binding protein